MLIRVCDEIEGFDALKIQQTARVWKLITDIHYSITPLGRMK